MLYSSKEFNFFDKKLIKNFIEKYTEIYKNKLIKDAHSYKKRRRWRKKI